MSRRSEITCRRLVELVTGYLEDTLDPATRSAVEAHFEACTSCATYLEQMRQLKALGSRLVAEPAATDAVPPGLLGDLLEEFRRRRFGA